MLQKNEIFSINLTRTSRNQLCCYDRVVITGTVPHICYVKGMTEWLNSHKIRIFDYPQYADQIRHKIRENAEQIARESGLQIEHLNKPHIRKEEHIKKILKTRGTHPGLVYIISVMESCESYKPWHDKMTGKTYLRPNTS